MHSLTDVDGEARTGVCAVCGPVSLKSKGSGRWACRTAWRARSDNSLGAKDRRRKNYRKHLAGSCERCGFVPENARQLDIHHRDHDHRNDDPTNLGTLCANCHRLEH